MKKTLWIPILALAMWMGAACSSPAGPKQIAAAQRATPIAEFPGFHPIIYQATLELQVADVDDAAARAADLAQRYGGALVGSDSWFVDGRKVSLLRLNVPTTNFDRLRSALISLGVLVNEWISSRPPGAPPDAGTFSSITLQLRPAEAPWPPAPEDGRWNPARTFQRAFDVFLTIFGFLADVLIWALVVVGPFALIFFIAWRLIRRRRGERPARRGRRAAPGDRHSLNEKVDSA